MEEHRKHWNEQQKVLRKALKLPVDLKIALPLFLEQNAVVHSAKVTNFSGWSFEDEVVEGLPDAAWRVVPARSDHSIAWLVWHMTRIEDITMNILLAGKEQLFTQQGWGAQLGIRNMGTGNLMPQEEVQPLSDTIDLGVLKDYRREVCLSTRRNVQALSVEALDEMVKPERLQRLIDVGAVTPQTHGLIDYWGSLTLAGLLLMPPTRHLFIHWNEAVRIKRHIPLK